MGMGDIRDDILRSALGNRITASIVADDRGIVVETVAAAQQAEALGLTVRRILPEGSEVNPGDEIARLAGSPKQVVMAEDRLIGLMAKPSGIATAARRFVTLAGDRPKIVAGAWKKMPGAMKESIRRAAAAGGAKIRISSQPFLYLDKNYVRMLGGIAAALEAVAPLAGYLKVLQLKGHYQEIALEASDAATHGADVLFVDSGRWGDIRAVSERLKKEGLRDRVKIAFGGNIRSSDVTALKAFDVDILDVGRDIVDAPLLDMRLEVVAITELAK
jgi:nicotinate-nucleotide pyrophosphorylase (carboxylating)